MSFLDVFKPPDTVDFYAEFLDEGGRSGYIVFGPGGVEFHPSLTSEQTVSFGADQIVDVMVHKDDQSTQRVTLTRLLLFKIYALAFPKKQQMIRTIITIQLDDGSESTFALKNQRGDSVWSRVSQYVDGYGGLLPEDGHPSIAEEIAHIAQLHEDGALSDEEFERAKTVALRDERTR